MKNLLIFYSVILSPFSLLVWLAINGKSEYFALGLLLYVVYRNFTDGYRLYLLGLIPKTDIFKFKIFLLRHKYFSLLYFGR